MLSNRLFLTFCTVAAAWAGAAVRGPVMGFVFDSSTRAIRPMRGVPGAAYLGVPVVPDVDNACIAPDGATALVTRDGQTLLYTSLANTSPAALPVAGAIANADRCAWSPHGGSVALWSTGGNRAQILAYQSFSFTLSPVIDLSRIPGHVEALAFDGAELIIAASADSSGGIYSVTAVAGPLRLVSASAPSALALAGSDLYFADKKSKQIWQVRSYASQPLSLLFANDNMTSPIALQVSSDGARLVAADAGGQTLIVYEIAARSEIRSLDLSFAPTALDRFGSPSMFLLTSISAAPAPSYILSDDGVNTVTYFVPGPSDSNQQ